MPKTNYEQDTKFNPNPKRRQYRLNVRRLRYIKSDQEFDVVKSEFRKPNTNNYNQSSIQRQGHVHRFSFLFMVTFKNLVSRVMNN